MTNEIVYPLRSELTIQRANFGTLMDRLSAAQDALTLTQVQLEIVTAERDQARARSAELAITHSAYEQMRSERNDAQDDLEAITAERDQVRAWVVGTQAYLWRCGLSDQARAWVIELVRLLDTKPNNDEQTLPHLPH